MPASLSNQNISNTYKGLLHTQGDSLPSTGNIVVTDGSGQSSSLALGVVDQGIKVTGTSEFNDINASYVNLSGLSVGGDDGIVSLNTPKAWAIFAGNDGTLRAGYNVDSITTPTPGEFEVTFQTALPSENYVVQTSLAFDNTTPSMVCTHVMSVPVPTNASFKMKTYKLVGSTPTQFQPTTVSVTVYHA